MQENMMTSDHKATNVKSREGWDLTFGKPGQFDPCIACPTNSKNGGTGKCVCQLVKQFNGK